MTSSVPEKVQCPYKGWKCRCEYGEDCTKTDEEGKAEYNECYWARWFQNSISDAKQEEIRQFVRGLKNDFSSR